ncbi:alpha/beta fold hydrolase [Streptomyces sp. UG1]|uniref:alpha/beta fold hydrolase n=1 Tax=Streptomyces sp. UG1 TaxID=3417652 RepID=UPI003CF54A9E
MNDIAELKEYVRVHARGQGIKGYRQVLDRIHCDEGDGPGSWVGEWCRAAERLTGRGNDLARSRHYALARFPYVDGPARREAQERCVEALDRWRTGQRGIERLDVELAQGRVRCWASGLSTTDPKPLLVVMGGIVTVKEQWAPLLAAVGRIGMAGVVTEMPGVGENELRYGPDSAGMLSALLDAVADRADVTRTHAITLSFSGHMALGCALDDLRISSVITVGAPVGTFFTDLDWRHRLPRITVDTLAHLTGTEPSGIVGGLGKWALTGEQLDRLDIPVHYVASLRDEIIPASDVQLLRDHVRALDLVEFDDVHGSPRHVRETQLWILASLLRDRDVRTMQSALVSLALRLRRLGRRTAGSRA